jgi:hypothetical protein
MTDWTDGYVADIDYTLGFFKYGAIVSQSWHGV